MATGQVEDPLRRFIFMFESDGILQGGFMECSGVSAAVEPTEFNEGGLNSASHKLAGRTKHTNITLKRGLLTLPKLYLWFQDVMNGKVVRQNCSIIIFDTEGAEKVRWNLARAYPTRWSGPDLNANANEVAVETLELAHEGLSLSS